MALQKQVVSIPFAQGEDTKTDPFQLPMGKLQSLSNGYFPNVNSLRGRDGFDGLPVTYYLPGSSDTSSKNLSAAVGIAPFKNELVLFDKIACYSFNREIPASGAWGQKPSSKPIGGLSQVFTAPFTSCKITETPAFRNGFAQNNADSAFVQGANGPIQCFISQYDVGQGLRASVVDGNTGETFLDQGFVSGVAVRPKVLRAGSYFYVIYVDAITGFLMANRIDTSLPTDISTAFTWAANLNVASTVYDACVGPDGNIYVIYNDTLSRLTVSRFSAATGLLTATFFDAGHFANREVTIWPDLNDAAHVWIAWSETPGNHTYYAILPLSLSAYSQSPVLISATGVNAFARLTGASTDAGHSVLLGVPNTFNAIIQFRLGPGSSWFIPDTVETNGRFSTAVLASKCAYINGDVFAYTGYVDDPLQQTLFLTCWPAPTLDPNNLSQPSMIARMSPGLWGSEPTPPLPEINILSATQIQTVFLKTERLSSALDPTLYTQKGVQSVKADLFAPIQVAELANTLHIASGLLWMYDGSNIVEHGFNHYPANVQVSGALPAGSGTVRQYVLIWEWTDAQGQLHRSQPSVPVSVDTGAGVYSATVTYNPFHLTAKTGVRVALYRTTGNGTIFFRVSSIIATTSTLATTGTFTDTAQDADIEGNEQLYTTGGEVENGATPPVLTLATYKNRLVIVDAENPLSWWYSKEVIPGVPVEFSALFTQNLDSRGGDTSALGVLDDKLIFFKDTHIFAVVGDGPTPAGTNNDFTTGQMIATDTGCIDRDSVALMPQGLMYRSHKGIELLDRSLQASYIGAPVEAFVTPDITVRSGTLVAALNQVRFITSETMLVYDYFTGQWSTYDTSEGVNGIVWQNVFSFVGPDGRVHIDGGVTDLGSVVITQFTTGWLSFAGLQGFQRVYKAIILGTFQSAHTLTIEVAYDFKASFVQTETITASGTPPYQYRILLNRQKCESIQFRITLTPNAGLGNPAKLSGLALEVGLKGGVQRAPTNRTYG